MAGYLIAEEGPLSGQILRFEEGEEWILGRDPDVAGLVLEDPMVSRKHVICRLTPEGFLLENLSSVNPATQNGKVITEAVLLREGDIIQIGSTFFRFSEKNPIQQELSSIQEEPQTPPVFAEAEDLSSLSYDASLTARWLLKVISGPNAGAEFNMQKNSVYIIGKDSNLCDIVFQDLSVSRQHARLSVDEEEKVYIEDLGSRNGVLVNAELITEKRELSSQDLVALGTTTFLIIDREQVRETIISPPATLPQRMEGFEGRKEEVLEEAARLKVEAEKALPPRDWKEMLIARRHLIVAGVLAFLIFLGIVALFSLFKSEPIISKGKNETEQIQDAVHPFQDIQFSFNTTTGKLFLVGHVLSNIDKQELLYILHGLSFVDSIEDNVVVDEYVWENMNALLLSHSDWQGVAFHSPTPGRFVVRGYLETADQAQALSDYINVNFPYLDRLDNQVVVEGNLSTQIQSILFEKGFSGITFQLNNGELVLSGMADNKRSSQLDEMIDQFKGLLGIRSVKNYIVVSTAESSRIDLSSKYQVTGYSKKDSTNLYVVINGRIVSEGDNIDGMMITAVQPNLVLLEKDGLKFRINYNLQ